MYLLLFLSVFAPLMAAQEIPRAVPIKQESRYNFLDSVTKIAGLQDIIRNYMHGYDIIINEPSQHYHDATFACAISHLAVLEKTKLQNNQYPSIIVYNLKDKKSFTLNSQNRTHLNTIASSSDGTLVAGGHQDQITDNPKCCEAWHMVDKKYLGSYESNRVKAVTFSPNSVYFAVAARHGYLTNIKNGNRGYFPRIASSDITVFSPDSSLVAFASTVDNKIYIVKTADRSLVQTLTLEQYDGVHTIQFSSDNKHLCIIQKLTGNGITIWNIATGQMIRSLPHSGRSFAIHPTESKIATIAQDKPRTIHIWDIASGQQIKSMSIENPALSDASLPDFSISDFSFNEHDIKAISAVNCSVTCNILSEEFQNITFSPNGHYIFIDSPSGGYIRGISQHTSDVKMDIKYNHNSTAKISPNWEYIVILSPFQVIMIDLPHSPV